MTDETWIPCKTPQKDFPLDSVAGEKDYYGLKVIFICEKLFQIEDSKSGQADADTMTILAYILPVVIPELPSLSPRLLWLHKVWKGTEGRCI